jgi:hypothetical protein
MSTIVQTQTTSFKKELYEAVHNLPVDAIKIALYTANASLDEATTVYSTANEVVGPGYVAGGVVMTGVTVNASGYTAYVDFADATWAGASFTARCALIYNSSKANRSIAVLDFGADKTASGAFVIQMPANSPTTALIRSSN